MAGDAAIAVGVAGASALVVRVVRAIALRTGWLDTPNARSAHVKPTPRLGGIGIMVAFLPAAAWAAWKAGNGHALVIVTATGFVSAVGLVDDLRPLPARVRFGAQCLAAGAVVFGGWDHLHQGWALLGALPSWLLVPLSLLWIVWLTNLYNFMDGIDGLAGGQAVMAGVGVAIAAGGVGAPLLGTLALLLAAAALGFLVFNFPPASIFMGDVGSTAIGFLLASLPFLAHEPTVPVEAVGVALALFILDATITLIRRLSRGEKFFHAHRSHFYQRPLAHGIPHRRVTLAAYGGMLLTSAGCAAWPALALPGRVAVIGGTLLLFLAYVAAVLLIERREGK
jgi:UDP-N-acetylmuramyl pentapeptide phosphotransferase/UDP-N-acetylglucosamine-1-phosphate transferase